MNISQFLKSLGLEHLRDIFETEQVNSCVLFQLFSFELAAVCFLYYISSLFCDLKCSTICLMRDLFVFTLLAACDSFWRSQGASLHLSDSWETYPFSLWAVFLSDCHVKLDPEKWGYRILGEHLVNLDQETASRILFYFVLSFLFPKDTGTYILISCAY